MESPNDEELELITQLRENVRDLDLCEDALSNANLIRWIRARNHNVNAAEYMFRKYIKWFDEIELGSIFDVEVPKEVSAESPVSICGISNIGCPIAIFPAGKVDAAKLMKDGYKDEIMTYCLQLIERYAFLCRNLKATDNNRKSSCVLKLSAIVDLDGLSWKQVGSPYVVQHNMALAKTVEAYYPETIYKIIVINAPRIFTIIWAIMKQFVSEKTMEKIQIFGNDREQWQAALYKLASKESLPIKYGGILPDDVDILPKCHECVPKTRGGY